MFPVPEFVKEVMIPLSALTKVPMFLVLLRLVIVPLLFALIKVPLFSRVPAFPELRNFVRVRLLENPFCKVP